MFDKSVVPIRVFKCLTPDRSRGMQRGAEPHHTKNQFRGRAAV